MILEVKSASEQFQEFLREDPFQHISEIQEKIKEASEKVAAKAQDAAKVVADLYTSAIEANRNLLEGLARPEIFENLPDPLRNTAYFFTGMLPIIVGATETLAYFAVVDMFMPFVGVAPGIAANPFIAPTISFLLKLVPDFYFANEAVRSDRKRRGLTDEDVENLEGWAKIKETTRSLAVGFGNILAISLVGSAIAGAGYVIKNSAQVRTSIHKMVEALQYIKPADKKLWFDVYSGFWHTSKNVVNFIDDSKNLIVKKARNLELFQSWRISAKAKSILNEIKPENFDLNSTKKQIAAIWDIKSDKDLFDVIEEKIANLPDAHHFKKYISSDTTQKGGEVLQNVVHHVYKNVWEKEKKLVDKLSSVPGGEELLALANLNLSKITNDLDLLVSVDGSNPLLR